MIESVYVGVALSAESLTDDELSALILTIEWNDKNLDKVAGYDKVKGLWENGKMHEETKEALLAYAYQRLSK